MATERRPYGKNLLVRVDTEDGEKQVGSLIVPATVTSGTQPDTGTVVAVGDVGGVSAGDRVLFRKYVGAEIELEGVKHLVLEHEHILLVWNE